MDAPHHMAVIMEVDLSACHPNTLVDRINAVPVLKTSAAFFSFLRANLVLPHSEMSSNLNTPVLGPVTTPTVSKKATRGAAASAPKGAEATLDEIPPLTLGVLTERADKVDALQLLADSVAQQRQTASRSLVFHPLNLAGLAAGVGIAYQFVPRHDLGVMLTVMSGVVMSYLAAIRYFSSPYIFAAEKLNWEWLRPSSENGNVEQEQDTIIGARYGDAMIGALVLRLEGPNLPTEKTSSTGSSTDSSTAAASLKRPATRSSTAGSANTLSGGHGYVRGWTTRLRYRRRGIGGDLLQEALRVTRERCGKDAEISFAADHANHTLVLHDMYNGPFHKTEKIAAKAMEKTLAAN
ncbi:gnat family [Ophiostoma piceae UAMH 11346]|uniref:Gnat family n=1 Tax=Ophiostoma piceae (strain UAMH 11346) TaxID=1262450 RepID=S3D8Z8_OPHP1|nr:gnat family [Ophiostoma piceae UAMH 11346]